MAMMGSERDSDMEPFVVSLHGPGVTIDDIIKAERRWHCMICASTCAHDSADGVDQTPTSDPEKRWRCNSCGVEFVEARA